MPQIATIQAAMMPLTLGQIPAPIPPFSLQPALGAALDPNLAVGEQILSAVGERIQTADGPVFRVSRGTGGSQVSAYFRHSGGSPPCWQTAASPNPDGRFSWTNCGPAALLREDSVQHAWLNTLIRTLGDNPMGDRHFRSLMNLHRDGSELLSATFQAVPGSATSEFVMQTGEPGIRLHMRWNPTGDQSGRWEYRLAAGNEANGAPADWQALSVLPPTSMPQMLRERLGWNTAGDASRAADAWQQITSALRRTSSALEQLANPATRSEALASADTIRASAAYLRLNAIEGPSSPVQQDFVVSGTANAFRLQFHRATGAFRYSSDSGASWTTITATSAAPYSGAALTPEQTRANAVVAGLSQRSFSGLSVDSLKKFSWCEQLIFAAGGRASPVASTIGGATNYECPLPNGGSLQIRPLVQGESLQWQYRTSQPGSQASDWAPLSQFPSSAVYASNRANPNILRLGQVSNALARIFPASGGGLSLSDSANLSNSTLESLLAGDQRIVGSSFAMVSPVAEGAALFERLQGANLPHLRVSRLPPAPNDLTSVGGWSVTAIGPNQRQQTVEFRQTGVEGPGGSWRSQWQWSTVSQAAPTVRRWEPVSQGTGMLLPAVGENRFVGGLHAIAQRLNAITP